jgi:hypothetical protein
MNIYSPTITGSLNVTGSTSYVGNTVFTGSLIVSGSTTTTQFQVGSNALFVSSSGIITTPSQVSFKAYFSGANPAITKGVLTTMPYNAEEYDAQSNFSTSTYKFTAPVAGKYLFTVNTNMYGVDDAASIRILLTINSSTNRYLYWIQNAATGNTGDCNISGSDILNLASGNTVEVRILTDGTGTFFVSAGLDYNSFSGHLLG